MENNQIAIKCFKCGKHYTREGMRIDPNNPANMVCRNCLERTQVVDPIEVETPQNSVSSGAANAEKEESVQTVEVETPPQTQEEMINYSCTNCKYKFKRKPSQQVLRCPYCSNETSVKKDQSLNHMIDIAKPED